MSDHPTLDRVLDTTVDDTGLDDTVTPWMPVRALNEPREELRAQEQSEVLLSWLRTSGAQPRFRGSGVRSA